MSMDSDKMKRMLVDVWNKHLPETEERLSVLEHAAQSLRVEELKETDRQAAANAAHKLAGSLGTFGKHEGTEAARAIEQQLVGEEPLQPQFSEFLRYLEILKSVIRPG
jgi:HPt (histidine-containing phosphotransfer) domain-containing protein